jgi:hypothetical protein
MLDRVRQVSQEHLSKVSTSYGVASAYQGKKSSVLFGAVALLSLTSSTVGKTPSLPNQLQYGGTQFSVKANGFEVQKIGTTTKVLAPAINQAEVEKKFNIEYFFLNNLAIKNKEDWNRMFKDILPQARMEKYRKLPIIQGKDKSGNPLNDKKTGKLLVKYTVTIPVEKIDLAKWSPTYMKEFLDSLQIKNEKGLPQSPEDRLAVEKYLEGVSEVQRILPYLKVGQIDQKPWEKSYQDKYLTNDGKPLSPEEIEGLKKLASYVAFNDPSVSHVAGRSEKETATRLLDALNSALNAYGYTKISNDMRGIMEVCAASAWIKKTAQYGDSFGVKLTTDKIEFQKFLNQQEPAVVCEDSAAASRNLLRVMTKISNSGVNSYCVSMGRKFAFEDKAGAHEIFATILESGMVVYSDPTPRYKKDKINLKWTYIGRSFRDCAIDKIGRELFWATHYLANNYLGHIVDEQETFKRIKSGRPPFPFILGAGNAQGDEEWALSPYIGRSVSDNQYYGLWKFDWEPERKKLLEVEKFYGLFIK